jgi:hypothetical protein
MVLQTGLTSSVSNASINSEYSNDGDSKDEKVSWLFRKLLHKDARISKLFSREDPYYFHKTFGLLSLASFVYRYWYCYTTYGHLNFNGDALDWATMTIHLMLAFSSIIFRVPGKRIEEKPMVIYEEYRLHAMVFTARCFLVFACAVLLPKYYPDAPNFTIPLVVKGCHMLADYITERYGNGSTAVRANVKKMSGFYKAVSKGYSFYQFLAIASHILPNERIADLAYNAIIAIASSAFMMTLYRKRIIRGMMHLVVYSFCLLLSAFHIVRLIGLKATGLTLVTFLTRINLPREYSNKYVLWFCFYCIMNYDNMVYLQKGVEVVQPYLPEVVVSTLTNLAAQFSDKFSVLNDLGSSSLGFLGL